MVLRESALAHNLDAMRAWCDDRGVSLAPHGKTTMAPQLFQRQLDAGAWAITAATVSQARLMRHVGVPRVLIANEVVDPAGVAWLGRELSAHPDAWLACLVDSVASVAAVAAHGGDRRLPVLVELGLPGGRTGCRTHAEAIAVAEAVVASGTLALAGVEAFEGVLHDADDAPTVDALLASMRSLAQELCERGLVEDEVIVSAGGSVWPDRVADLLRGLDLGRPTRVLLRSGCYLTHDDGFYDRHSPFRTWLRPALEVWAAVLSRPEPTLALVGMGKRDVSHDIDLPVPLTVSRDCVRRAADGLEVFDLNDQHAFVRVPAADPLTPGDLMSFGISHPCTAFDKWRLLPVVDDELDVIGGVKTFF
jgi:D-serine deaminase-like pyridoxal phosphate-dependent protein